MPNFKVSLLATLTNRCTVEIEAESYDKAEELAIQREQCALENNHDSSKFLRNSWKNEVECTSISRAD